MRSHEDRKSGRRLARLARWLGFDRNPLRRGTDRIEAALRLVLMIMVVVAVPAAAVVAGQRGPDPAGPGDREPGPVHLRADRVGAGPLAAAGSAAPDR
jgi:hypothetical protein